MLSKYGPSRHQQHTATKLCNYYHHTHSGHLHYVVSTTKTKQKTLRQPIAIPVKTEKHDHRNPTSRPPTLQTVAKRRQVGRGLQSLRNAGHNPAGTDGSGRLQQVGSSRGVHAALVTLSSSTRQRYLHSRTPTITSEGQGLSTTSLSCTCTYVWKTKILNTATAAYCSIEQ